MWFSFCFANVTSCLCCKAPPCPYLVWRHHRGETSVAVAIFPSRESRLGEDVEGPQGSEATAGEALTGGDSLNPASLHAAMACYGQGNAVLVAHGDMPPSPVQPCCKHPVCCRFVPPGMRAECRGFWQQHREQLGFLAPRKLLKTTYVFERHLGVLMLKK